MDQNHILEQDCSKNVYLVTMHTHTQQHNNIYEVHLSVPPMSEVIFRPTDGENCKHIGKEWCYQALCTVQYGAEVIDMREEIDKLQKAENIAMRRILKAPKYTAPSAIRGEIVNRNKQHEGEIPAIIATFFSK